VDVGRALQQLVADGGGAEEERGREQGDRDPAVAVQQMLGGAPVEPR
jgi:hypothetical protein